MKRLVLGAVVASALAVLVGCAGDDGAGAADAAVADTLDVAATDTVAGVDTAPDVAPDGGPDAAPDVAAPDGDIAIDGSAIDDIAVDGSADGGPGDAGGDADAAAPILWRQVPAPLGADYVLHGLWGAPPSEDAPGAWFAVGVAGTVLGFDGRRWELALEEPSLDILNAVAGSGPADAWAVGMRGRAIRWDGARWRVPDACQVDADCGAGDPCKDGVCVDGACDYEPTFGPGCCGTELVAWDFDEGAGSHGFDFVDLYADDPDHGGIGWQVASVTPADAEGVRATSAPNALYFGVPDRACPGGEGVCPDYDNGRKVGGSATSQSFALPEDADSATLGFRLFLDVEASVHYDVFEVHVVQDGQAIPVWTKAELNGGTTRGRFLPVSVDLSRFTGRTIQLRFVFDTREQTDNAFEGAYVDDIVLETACGALDEGIGVTETLWGVTATGPDDYFAVGGGGTILRYDGRRWRRMMGGGLELPTDIDGSGSDDMHMVGIGGLSLRGPKGGWARTESGVERDLEAVWVHGPSFALAVGVAGTALRWDGAAWNVGTTGTSQALHGVSGTGPGDAIAVGDAGVVLAWDGATWRPSPASGMVNWALHGVYRMAPGRTWIVGDSGTMLEETAPGEWRNVPTGVSEGLLDVIAFPSGELMTVGLGGRYCHVAADGTKTNEFTPGAKTLFSVDGTGPDDIWAVGMEGTILHWDGAVWTRQQPLTDAPVTAVYAAAPDDAWAVVAGGMLLHWDGQTWDVARSTTSVTLRDVWAAGPNRAMAVGSLGTILHFDGVNWVRRLIEPVELPGQDEPWEIDSALHGVWGAADDDAWAVGGGGVIVHWDGETWTYTPTNDERARTLWAVWGRAADDVWAVGVEGAVLHYDGNAWTVQETNSVATLFAVRGVADDVWAVGSLGTILHYEP